MRVICFGYAGHHTLAYNKSDVSAMQGITLLQWEWCFGCAGHHTLTIRVMFRLCRSSHCYKMRVICFIYKGRHTPTITEHKKYTPYLRVICSVMESPTFYLSNTDNIPLGKYSLPHYKPSIQYEGILYIRVASASDIVYLSEARDTYVHSLKKHLLTNVLLFHTCNTYLLYFGEEMEYHVLKVCRWQKFNFLHFIYS